MTHFAYFKCLCLVSDVDECQKADVCPPQLTCKNTFGSFVCVCKDGFVMGSLRGSVECRGKKFIKYIYTFSNHLLYFYRKILDGLF